MRFIDEIEVILASGKGGDGCMSFRREAHVPRGGPDGGDGGKGGDLILRATSRKNTLVDLRRNKHYLAGSGTNGRTNNMTGRQGNSLVVEVPIGTVILNLEDGAQLADLSEEDAEWVIPGGKGGLGNPHFKSARNRTPRKTTPGQPSVEYRVRLELKLLADVGLLGFPNAGKSTFITAISSARPRVADYPFTTLVPNLGVVRTSWDQSFVVADIPGLVEGASEGTGLGHRFLKHVERCRVYVHLIASDAEEGPAERYRKLNRELEAYADGLADRPQIAVITKTDLAEDLDALVAELRTVVPEVFTICAPNREGLTPLLYRIQQALEADND